MAKRQDKIFKRMCRNAARDGFMNDASGRFVRFDSSAASSHMQAGYKVNEYDHPRKTDSANKKPKTGCCRGMIE